MRECVPVRREVSTGILGPPLRRGRFGEERKISLRKFRCCPDEERF